MHTSRDANTRETLLEVTVQHLLQKDESELRVLDICHETHLSTSVIYGNFGSRQGLIDAAYLRIYADVTESTILRLERAADASCQTNSFVTSLYQALCDPTSGDQVTHNRQMHLRVAAAALSRPNLRPAYLAIHDTFMKRRDLVYQRLIDESFLNSQLSARQWALFFEGQMLSRALNGVAPEWSAQSDWVAAARHFVALNE